MFFQTKITEKVISLYKNDMNIDYDSFEMDVFGETNIQNLLIKDHHNDTIIYVKELRVLKTPFFELLDNKINPNKIDLVDLKIKVVKYINETNNTLISLLERVNKNKNNFLFFSNFFRVKNGTFTFLDQNDKKKTPFVINDFSFISDNLNFSKKSISFSIDSMSISSNEKLLNIDYFKTDFNYKSNRIVLKDFEFENKFFNIEKGKLEINNGEFSSQELLQTSIINIDINKSKISPELFTFKGLDFNSKEYLDFALNGSGTINDFKLNKIDLKHPQIKFNANSSISLDNDLKFNKGEFFINDIEIADNLIYNTNSLSDIISSFLNDSIRVKFKLENNILGFDANLMSENGRINVSSKIPTNYFNRNNFIKDLNFDTYFDNLRLSSLIDIKESIILNGNIGFNISEKEKNDFVLNWSSNNITIVSSNKFPNILIDGYLSKNQVFNTLNVNNKILELKSDFKFDFSKNIPEYSAAINLLNFDLNSLGYSLGGGKALISGVSLINLKGKSFNTLEGSVNLSSLNLINSINEINFNPIFINQKISLNKREFLIENNDFVNAKIVGDFKNEEIITLIKNTFLEAYEIEPLKNISDKQALSFEINVYDKPLKAFYPKISFGSNIKLIGNLSSDNIASKIKIQFPIYTYDNFVFKDLLYELDLDDFNKKSTLKIKELNHKLYKINNFNLSSFSNDEGVLFESIFEGDEGNDLYDLKFLKIDDDKNRQNIVIKKSKITYRKRFWNLESNFQKKTIQFDNDLNEILIDNLKLSSENRFVNFSALFKNKLISELKINIKNLNLNEFIPIYPNFQLSGLTDLNLFYRKNLNNTSLNLNSEVKDLILNTTDLGVLNLSLSNNVNISDNYKINLSIIDDKRNKIIQSDGNLYGDKLNSFDIDFDINDLDISFLSKLSEKSINEIEGLASGNFKLIKINNKITHEGSLNLKNAKLSIPYLNVGYSINNSMVNLNNNNLIFNEIVFSDKEKNKGGLLNGKIYHEGFKNWAVDFKINSKGMLVLNKSIEESDVFYGKGYFSGNITLNGLTRNVNIGVNGRTEKNTFIKIPWSDTYEIQDDLILSFLDKNSNKNEEKFFDFDDYQRGVDIQLDLDVNNLAEIEIVLDKDSGSSLIGRGEGKLIMEADTDGKFNIWGDFTASEGLYNFKNIGLIDKKLVLSPGGSIIWDGNPLDAKMDFDAIYEVPGGANPAILLDNPSFNKKIPTEVKIHLEGKLLKPDDPIFEINFPNTSGTAESELNYRLTDPQIRQLQSLSLLSQGIFINEVGVSMQGITNNLYQKASDVFSNLLGADNEKLKIGVNYLQGDKSAILDVATEDRLGFTLSTKISEKILLNGKIGVPIGGLEQTLIVGNVQMDFLLNDEGSLKAKVFSKENEFRYLGDELGYTQGLGISYDVDFNSFKSLIKKISNKESNIKTKESDFINNSNEINFINKN
ncbi:MAG: hypothetical protein CMC88_00415 [Flavobacteriaceae bacterium]|nr:hypothetical protein [Flavobacteriaceae bacterium]